MDSLFVTNLTRDLFSSSTLSDFAPYFATVIALLALWYSVRANIGQRQLMSKSIRQAYRPVGMLRAGHDIRLTPITKLPQLYIKASQRGDASFVSFNVYLINSGVGILIPQSGFGIISDHYISNFPEPCFDGRVVDDKNTLLFFFDADCPPLQPEEHKLIKITTELPRDVRVYTQIDNLNAAGQSFYFIHLFQAYNDVDGFSYATVRIFGFRTSSYKFRSKDSENFQYTPLANDEKVIVNRELYIETGNLKIPSHSHNREV